MLMTIQFESETPIYQQIHDQVILGLAKGELHWGEDLPSVRAMSEEIGVNMMTIQKGYQALKDEGILVSDRRSGTKIVTTPPKIFTNQAKFQEILLQLMALAKIHNISLEEMNETITKIYHDLERK
ncbi:DNA-binding transcriptional regulator YhcF, GntR family [Pilibacter termitis]|uniref:DNA-binding transcriptional regulator YhcF, GntR family n=1 Tax=Pilibacter termitis TaxID=263852 RepID=A0A1T4KV30_9ENTE|nr:GntR family transcriptional regulator [Pilibacter termitis]SJZ46295.1 DNA-binding transcriptional regulator YhcF, GntR family [Pilibacter termitis]